MGAGICMRVVIAVTAVIALFFVPGLTVASPGDASRNMHRRGFRRRAHRGMHAESPDMVFAVVVATFERPHGGSLDSLNRSLSSVLAQTNRNWVIYLSGDNYQPGKVADLHPVLSRIPPGKLSWGNLNVPGERGRWPGLDAVWRCAGAEAINYALERVEMSFNPARNNTRNVIMTHLDDDDTWTPDHLAVLAETYEEFPLASFVYTRSIFRTTPFPDYNGATSYNNCPPRSAGLIHNSASWKLADFFGWRYRTCNTTDAPVDADMWGRMAAHMRTHGLKSVLNPRVTTYHLTQNQR